MGSKIKLMVMVLSLLGILATCLLGSGSAIGAETMKIGAIYPRTGNLALLGNENLDGAKIAVDMINEAGGVLGQQVELLTGDASTPDKAQSETERLISFNGIKIITGTYSSGLSYAASQVAERRQAFYWETGGIADRLTQRGFKYYFRLVFTATSNGELAANVSKSILSPMIGQPPEKLKVFITHEDSDYGTSVASAAEAMAQKNGFQVLGRFPYKASSTDLSPLILKMKSSAPDIVIASSYANDALLIQRVMKQLGVNVKAFIGTGGIYGLPSFAEGVGSAVNGIIDTEGSGEISTAGLTEEAKKQSMEFKRRYQEKLQKVPSYVATQGFVGTYLLLKDVIPAAGSIDPDKVREAALKLDIPMGGTALGWGVKFAQPGDPMAGTNLRSFPVAQQYQDGKLVVIAPDSVKTGAVKNIPLPTWDKR